MITKVCSKCKQSKEAIPENFNRRSNQKDGLNYYCRECDHAKGKKFYDGHKAQIYEKEKRLKKAKRQWWVEFKQDLYCKECGESRWQCITFHHRDPKSKSFALGDAINRNLRKESILEEIEKCDVLCANCHMVLHNIEAGLND